MRQTHRLAAGVVALAMVSGGCFGSFNLTKKLYHWNDAISKDRWAKEFVFLVLAWVPVYSLAGLGDAIVFNSFEFWTGKNPIEPTKASLESPHTTRIARHDSEAVLTHLTGPKGEQLLIKQFAHGQPAASLRIAREGGVSVATDQDGKALFIAQTLPDGSLLVSDGQGKQVAFYSAEEVDRLVSSVTP